MWSPVDVRVNGATACPGMAVGTHRMGVWIHVGVYTMSGQFCSINENKKQRSHLSFVCAHIFVSACRTVLEKNTVLQGLGFLVILLVSFSRLCKFLRSLFVVKLE